MRSLIPVSLLFCSSIMTACGVHTPEASENQEPVATARPYTQTSLVDERSCLENCGYEARGTIYASCLEMGDTQQNCGSSARVWYRECLESRCDESAVQQDDCRTDCRLQAKENLQQCAADDNECTRHIRTLMRTCVDEC